jgi:hypothetical protein
LRAERLRLASFCFLVVAAFWAVALLSVSVRVAICNHLSVVILIAWSLSAYPALKR